MPRAKRASDEVYNARRRAKRQAARFEKQAKAETDAAQRNRLVRTAKELRGYAAQTYADKKRQFSESVEKAVSKISELYKNIGQKMGKEQRSDAMFRRELNRAATGETSTQLGKYGQQKFKIFMRATQRMWEGKPAEERYNAIIEGMGVSSLEEAFRQVMKKNRKTVKEMEKEFSGRDTSGFGEEGGSQEEEPSPDYLYYVKMI